jgi:hypothetical protein
MLLFFFFLSQALLYISSHFKIPLLFHQPPAATISAVLVTDLVILGKSPKGNQQQKLRTDGCQSQKGNGANAKVPYNNFTTFFCPFSSSVFMYSSVKWCLLPSNGER